MKKHDSKYLRSEKFMSAVGRIETGEWTRATAAEHLGTSVASLNVRLSRAGLLQRLKGVRNYSGEHLFKPNPDKASDYASAVTAALQEGNVRQVWLRYPQLSYPHLCLRVRQSKSSAP